MKNALSYSCAILYGLLFSATGISQSNPLYNPDYNGDGFIGVDDILGALSFYGNTWIETNPSSWSCGDMLVYSGLGYSTVQIGDQCWFAENLRTTTFINGDNIPLGLSDADWMSTSQGAMAYFNNVPSSGLYNWFAVVDFRGLCPDGWHVPTDDEWNVMTDYLDGIAVAGGQMKSTYGWIDNGNGTNSSGFSGLPGGYRIYNTGFFIGAGTNGSWWSSSPHPNGSSAWARGLANYSDEIYPGYDVYQSGHSVRCIQDY